MTNVETRESVVPSFSFCVFVAFKILLRKRSSLCLAFAHEFFSSSILRIAIAMNSPRLLWLESLDCVLYFFWILHKRNARGK